MEYLRNDGTSKGMGWLGPQKTVTGKDMTEYSIGINIDGKEIDIPTLVPSLTPDEIEFLKTEPKEIPQAIINKAVKHAIDRIRAGESPFKETKKYTPNMKESTLEN